MRFIVIGAGDVGTSLSERLAQNQHDVVLVEKDEDKLARATASLDIQPVVGSGLSPDTLVRAGVNTADYLISVADIDEVNIASCLVAKLINPKAKRIARIRDISLVHKEISPEHLSEYFDLIINPDQAAAGQLLEAFRVPGAKELVEFGDGRLRVLGLSITAQSPVANRRLHSLQEYQDKFPVLIIAIMRRNQLIVPGGSDQLKIGDVVYAITLPEKTSILFELAGRELVQGRSAMIWGSTALARSLAHSLEKQGTKVKLILEDRQASTEIVDEFRESLVLLGDGTDQNLLVEENVGDVDAFVAVTNHEEDNILAALLAKRLGAKSSMALVNKGTYLPLVNAIGVDVVVSSRIAAASSIFNHIHSESLISEISIAHHGAGFIEFYANNSMSFLGQPLKDIKFPHGIIVAAIMRGNEVIIPKGSDTILDGDRIVVFVIRSAFKKLEKLLGIKLDLFF